MNGSFIIFIFSLLAYFDITKGAQVQSTEREKTIEDIISSTFEDPRYLGNFSVGPGDGVLRVKQIVNNMICSGLSEVTVKELKADLTAGTVFLSYEAEKLTTTVDYELDGSWLFVPIWGEGSGVVVMNDVKATVNATVETVDDKISITDLKITYVANGGSFELSSLFNEPQPRLLTRIFMKVFNANSKYIFDQILPLYIPTSEAILTRFWGSILANV